MKERWNRMAWVAGLGILLAGGPVCAQTSDTNTVGPVDSIKDGPLTLPGGTTSAELNSLISAARPDRPERLVLPQDVLLRLREFERLRENYLARQKELQRRLHGASDADRARIREMLREQRQTWMEQARRFREEAQRRLEDLKLDLPRHREVLDAAKERARDAAKTAKDRHGQD